MLDDIRRFILAVKEDGLPVSLVGKTNGGNCGGVRGPVEVIQGYPYGIRQALNLRVGIGVDFYGEGAGYRKANAGYAEGLSVGAGPGVDDKRHGRRFRYHLRVCRASGPGFDSRSNPSLWARHPLPLLP